ncbi:MAG: chorismate synthase [Hyphomonas sp.]
MSINAVRARASIGAGFERCHHLHPANENSRRKWPQAMPFEASSCRTGGVAGGISTGQDVVVRIAIKPTSSILNEVKSITRDARKSIFIFGSKCVAKITQCLRRAEIAAGSEFRKRIPTYNFFFCLCVIARTHIVNMTLTGSLTCPENIPRRAKRRGPVSVWSTEERLRTSSRRRRR